VIVRFSPSERRNQLTRRAQSSEWSESGQRAIESTWCAHSCMYIGGPLLFLESFAQKLIMKQSNIM